MPVKDGLYAIFIDSLHQYLPKKVDRLVVLDFDQQLDIVNRAFVLTQSAQPEQFIKDLFLGNRILKFVVLLQLVL